MKKAALFICLFIFTAIAVSAQDKIYKKDGEVLSVKILEIGLDEIKYKIWDNQEGPTYSIDKELIKKVVYNNGRTEVYQSNLKDPALYADQRNMAIKLDFIKPLLGYTAITFEKSVKLGQSFEVELDIIGAGKNFEINYYDYDPSGNYQTYRRNARGVGAGFGYKFIKTPNYVTRGIKFGHIMQGSYIKPTVYVGNYTHNFVDYKTNQTTVEEENVTYGAVMIEFGKQWTFSDRMVLDLYFGLGYAFDNAGKDAYDSDYQYGSYNFAVARLGKSPSIGVTGGLRIGYLLKKK